MFLPIFNFWFIVSMGISIPLRNTQFQTFNLFSITSVVLISIRSGRTVLTSFFFKKDECSLCSVWYRKRLYRATLTSYISFLDIHECLHPKLNEVKALRIIYALPIVSVLSDI